MNELDQRVAALETQLAALHAVHDIQQLRFEYWFALADKDVQRLLGCFTEDVHLDYGFDIKMTGIETIGAFFKELLDDKDLVRQVPRGSNPQIKILSATEASGRWLVEVSVLRHSQEDGRRIGVQYFEKYRRTGDGWKICEMKNDYLSFESFVRRDSP